MTPFSIDSIRKRWRLLSFGGLALLLIATIAVFIQTPGGAREDPVPAAMWPAFTMTYSEYEIDPVSRAVLADQTHRLTVTDDYTWRDEVIRDDVEPALVGSYRTLQDGMYTLYLKMIDHRQEVAAAGTVGISDELAPTFYPYVRDGKLVWAGFNEVSAGSGRYAAERLRSEGDRPVTERIEFDTTHITDVYQAGITVKYERKVGTEVVRTFTVDSLAFN